MDLLEKEGELQPRGKLLLTSSAGFWELTVEISCGIVACSNYFGK
jgi:hypothetical protein